MAILIATLCGMGQTAIGAEHAAMDRLKQMLVQQPVVLAYAEPFRFTALVAFAAIPLTFLFRGSAAGGRRWRNRARARQWMP